MSILSVLDENKNVFLTLEVSKLDTGIFDLDSQWFGIVTELASTTISHL
jgi:hypothetical protein